MRPKTAYPQTCTYSLYIDFIPSKESKKKIREQPGPGKYNTIDHIGNQYVTSKNKQSPAKSFKGGNRFQ